MPAKSEAQRKAMYAASEGRSTLGIPASVGKEFVGADGENEHVPARLDIEADAVATDKSAGIAFIHNDRFLLIKRGPDGDAPDTWAFPGGHIELGETAQQAAIRECLEEVGFQTDQLLPEHEDIDDFCLFFAKADFIPTLNDESTGYVWATMDELPKPLHPNLDKFLDSIKFKSALYMPRNELEVARRIQDGSLTSPQKFANMWLFNIRITGTGTAYRSRGDEFVHRPPEHYMNSEFLARCNGLPVIWEHPEKGTLNSDEYADRNIGSIFIPYLKEDVAEVWGIAKIFDETAAQAMTENILSTSPTVVFTKQDGNDTIRLEDGTDLLIEGCPSLLDHVAICVQGVWDKGGNPTGVVSDSVTLGVVKMNEEDVKAKADADEKDAFQKKFDAMMSAVDSLTKKVDAMAEAGKGEPEAVVADKKADAEEEDKAKADAEDEESKAKAKADAEEIKKRIDSVEAMMPKAMADEDMEAMADAQAKADSVASAFGNSASRPQNGETVIGYRKRLANKFKAHSAAYKDIDISKIADDSLFAIAEKQIYQDAYDAANNPVLVQGETLREVKSRSPAGHQISTFKGSISSWMDNFKADAFKVTQLNTGAK